MKMVVQQIFGVTCAVFPSKLGQCFGLRVPGTGPPQKCNPAADGPRCGAFPSNSMHFEFIR